jgi:hypothetical protein
MKALKPATAYLMDPVIRYALTPGNWKIPTRLTASSVRSSNSFVSTRTALFHLLPSDLQGLYEAWHHVENPDEIEEQWIKISLTLKIDDQNRVVRATEAWEIHFRGADEALIPSGEQPSEGWGIVTPEGNLCLFMKTKPYERHYYYLPVGVNSGYLALLRHQPPEDRGLPETFEQLTEQMKKRTLLLNFNKVAKLNGVKGDLTC